MDSHKYERDNELTAANNIININLIAAVNAVHQRVANGPAWTIWFVRSGIGFGAILYLTILYALMLFIWAKAIVNIETILWSACVRDARAVHGAVQLNAMLLFLWQISRHALEFIAGELIWHTTIYYSTWWINLLTTHIYILCRCGHIAWAEWMYILWGCGNSKLWFHWNFVSCSNTNGQRTRLHAESGSLLCSYFFSVLCFWMSTLSMEWFGACAGRPMRGETRE